MRYEPDQKAKTRERVLKAAAKAIRAEGPHNLAVAKVMGDAGLTVGGFYAHFASKDDLVAATIDQMFAEAKSRALLETEGRAPAQALGAYVDFYLSATHRDSRTTGCPMPFLAADLPRLTTAARERFAAGVAMLRSRMAFHLSRLGRGDAEADASSMVAELVGALSLARAEPDPTISDAILDRSKAALKRRFGLEA
ncbi:MAG TPA: TetR/AcrR family transcriptional regulator [Caulobacteraceae bacterium]|nr:TetR/AcrR family transcriptional regulator [Caulobacteraceae bacterium]